MKVSRKIEGMLGVFQENLKVVLMKFQGFYDIFKEEEFNVSMVFHDFQACF